MRQNPLLNFLLVCTIFTTYAQIIRGESKRSLPVSPGFLCGGSGADDLGIWCKRTTGDTHTIREAVQIFFCGNLWVNFIMVLTEDQFKLLEGKRKVSDKCPKFDPQITIRRNFEQAFKNWTKLVGVQDMGNAGQPAEFIEFTKLVLSNAMQKTAIERINPYCVGSEPANACATLDQYIDLLKSVFQPPSESRSLKQEFKMAKQSKNEDVSSYLSSKLSLYDSAYTEAQRDHEYLLTEVINGLYSNVIKRRLRNADGINTRADLRTRLFDLVAKEREQVLGGYAESTSLDGLNTVASVHRRPNETVGPTAGESREEPMDIDAIQEKIAQLETMKKGFKGDDKVETRKCFGCQQVGHIKRKCPNKDKWLKPGGGQKQKKEKDKCVHCLKKGHTVENCFKRKADKAERIKREKIQSLEETSETAKGEEQSSEEEEEVGFLADARGVVFH